MINFETIELIINENIATIWFNRPEVRNGFNEVMIAEVTKCINSINENEKIRIVVFRGRSKSFSAGADLNWLGGVAKYSFEENYSESSKLADCFHLIYTCKKPTIAVAHGASIGGANGFLAACDFAFCEESTVFSLSEVKIGIVPSCISPYVRKRVGEYVAKELMLSGQRFYGKDAQQYRLVNKSLPKESLEEYVENTIKQLLTSGPGAMAACKNLIYDISNELTFEESIDYTAKMIAELRASKEGQEGMASFLERRKPNWVGKS
ncbi:enoyl-CoA hydratase-related protein [Bacteroidota bacterium]